MCRSQRPRQIATRWRTQWYSRECASHGGLSRCGERTGRAALAPRLGAQPQLVGGLFSTPFPVRPGSFITHHSCTHNSNRHERNRNHLITILNSNLATLKTQDTPQAYPSSVHPLGGLCRVSLHRTQPIGARRTAAMNGRRTTLTSSRALSSKKNSRAFACLKIGVYLVLGHFSKKEENGARRARRRRRGAAQSAAGGGM